MNCHVDEDFDYPEDTRLAFEQMLNHDWRGELDLNAHQLNSAEDILWRHIRSIVGKELNSIKFLRQMQNSALVPAARYV